MLKEFLIFDKNGNKVLSIKLVDGRSKIFINEEEILVCRAIPINISLRENIEFKNIETINDVIEKYDRSFKKTNQLVPELDFFVNCSNLQAWVESGYDTKILDYRIAFPILKKLTENGNLEASIKFKEEVLYRYNFGNKKVRNYLENEFYEFLTDDEKYSVLPLQEQNALRNLKNYYNKIEEIKNAHIGKLYLIPYPISNYKEQRDHPLKEIGKLRHLKKLKLVNIPIKRSPPFLNYLSNLQELELFKIDLENLMRKEELSLLLKKMVINECNIKNLDEVISNIKSINTLILNHNSLTAIPESVGLLKDLEIFEALDNKLEFLPKSFSQLDNLHFLDLSENGFRELPIEIINLKSLKGLVFSSNCLTTLPNEIYEFKELKTLHLVNNQILTLPETIGKIGSLEILSLVDNKLQYLPETICNLKNLRQLDLTNNPIAELPKRMEMLPQLNRIYVRGTKITQKNIREYKKIFKNIEFTYSYLIWNIYNFFNGRFKLF